MTFAFPFLTVAIEGTDEASDPSYEGLAVLLTINSCWRGERALFFRLRNVFERLNFCFFFSRGDFRGDLDIIVIDRVTFAGPKFKLERVFVLCKVCNSSS